MPPINGLRSLDGVRGSINISFLTERRPVRGTVCLPLPLGEGRGEGLVRQARNNSQGFSSLNGLRAEARSTVVNAVWAQALTPTLSQRERESNSITTTC